MKTPIYTKLGFVLAVAIVPALVSCSQRSGEVSPSLVTSASAETIQEDAVSPPNPPAQEEITVAQDTDKVSIPPSNVVAAAATPVAEPKLPPSIKPQTPLAELVKLAQSGVDDAVMFSYITNSSRTFSAGSDEIIYLNDIGVPNNVITAVIEHDKAMKDFWSNQQQAEAAAKEAAAKSAQAENLSDQTAAAPSYVTPPLTPPVEQQPTIVNNNYFYDTLSPYGSWVNVDGYGPCWQPTVVVNNPYWQPYCDRGRWLYTDAGWYWHSDYSWGWAAFHYGRWFSHPRLGWCWYPDRVWAPSWVTWRSGRDYCGWAPLPPACDYRPGFGFSYYGRSVGFSFDFGLSASCYTFVPTARFCDPRPFQHRLHHAQVTQVFNNTTVINNYGSGNSTVINKGIEPSQISAVTKTEIPKVSIRERWGHGGGERFDRSHNTVVVNRPNVPEIPRNGWRKENLGTKTTSSATAITPITRTTEHSRETRAPRTSSTSGTDQRWLGRTSSQPVQPTVPVVENSRSSNVRTEEPRSVDSSPRNRTDASASAPVVIGSKAPVKENHWSWQRQNSDATQNTRRDNNRDTDYRAPLVIQGNETISSPPVRETKPGSSIVVIGKKDNAPSQQPFKTYSSPANAEETRSSVARNTWKDSITPAPSKPQPQAPLTFNAPQETTTRGFEQRRESRWANPAPSAPQIAPPTTYSAPVQSAPPVRQYSPPVRQNEWRSSSPTVAPQASPPTSYSRPQPSAPSAYSAPSAPAQSSQSQSQNSGAHAKNDGKR